MDLLSSEEIEFLDANGYLGLGQLLSQEQVDSINARLDELKQAEGENAGSELWGSRYIRHPKEDGVDRLANLVNKGEVFDILYTHPRLLAAVGAVLRNGFKLSSLNYRAAKPGKGNQKLHVDWKNAVASGGTYMVCNTIWLLDDFTEMNGATRLVAGTHKETRLPDEALEDPLAPHPDEIKILAPAGSVFVFNSHVWHGGTQNLTDKDRRSIHSYFCAADQPQQLDQKKYLTEETRMRIGEKGMKILAVNC